MIWDDRRNVKIHLGPKSVRKEVEDSLKRLRTDYIDLYQFHWPDPETPVEESWQVMAELKKEGKVKYIGVCNFNVPLLSRCASVAPVQSLQPPYSLVMQEVAMEILPYCLQNGIGVVAYSPMMSGLLTGKFNMQRLAEDDWRRKDKKFQEPLLSKELALVENLRPIAARYDKPVGNLAVAWVNMNPAITSSIVGARAVRQVEENVGGDFRIDEADMQTIERLYKETIG
jgi:aryl-alcohol dehydrogenase-like predicted oxidoreductase